MKRNFKVYLAFFRIGLFTFGGGYAMLPMIQKEIVERQGWATDEEVINCYAVGQCTPGAIAVNTATYIGYNQNGVSGAISATLGVISPSLIIITLISAVLQGYSDIPAVQYAFAGIGAAVSVLIFNALIKLWKSGVKNIWGGVIFALSFAAALLLDVPTIYIVVAAIAGGIMVQFIKNRRKSIEKPDEDKEDE